MIAHFVLSRNWTPEQAGELTLAQARWLISEEPYHDSAWQLIDFAARALGQKEGVIPARRVKRTSAPQVIPEVQRELEKLGWRGPV